MSCRWVLVINDPPPHSGASIVSRLVLDAVSSRRRDHEVFDVVSPANGLIALLRDGRAWLKSFVAVRSASFDVCYCQGANGARVIPVLVLALVCRTTSTPVFFHHHSYVLATQKSVITRVLFSRFLRIRHIVLTNGMGAQLEKNYGLEDFVVASNRMAVRSEFYDVKRRQAGESSPVRLTFVGRGGIGKGEDFCQLVAGSLAQSRKCVLTLAGPGHSRHGAVDLGDLRVNYVGMLAAPDLAELYARTDVLLLPSSYPAEAAPLVVFEALACGARVVASGSGLLPEIARDYEGLSVVKGFEVADWSDEVDRVLGSGEVPNLQCVDYGQLVEVVESSLEGFLPSAGACQ